MGAGEGGLYRTLSGGTTLAFVGEGGFTGVLVYKKDSGWMFHASGSTGWDIFHQMIYRNHRGEPLTPAQLEKEGIPPPPVDRYRGARPVGWAANFKSAMPFAEAPPEALQRLLAGGGSRQELFAVLREDEYETRLGDGYALEFHAAFWTEAEARRYLALMARQQDLEREENRTGYKFSLKALAVQADSGARAITADLRIRRYEWYGLDNVLLSLAKRSQWQAAFSPLVPWRDVPKQLKASFGGRAQDVYLAVQERQSCTPQSHVILHEAFWDLRAARDLRRRRRDEYVARCPKGSDYEANHRIMHELYEEMIVELRVLEIEEDAGGRGLIGEFLFDERPAFTFQEALARLACRDGSQ